MGGHVSLLQQYVATDQHRTGWLPRNAQMLGFKAAPRFWSFALPGEKIRATFRPRAAGEPGTLREPC